jgi:tetratricopeptide (TPR) repeat protein
VKWINYCVSFQDTWKYFLLLQGTNISRDKERTVDREPISRSGNKSDTHLSENKKQLNDLKKEPKERIDAGLKEIFEGISEEVERRVSEEVEKALESVKEKEKSVACDIISSKEEPLFSIDLDAPLENELNSEIISGKLKNVFETKKEFRLSENVYLVKEEDNRWKITDNDKIYIIKKEEDKILNIYREKLNITEVANALRSLSGEVGSLDRDEVLKNIELLDPYFEYHLTVPKLRKLKLIIGIATLLSEDESELFNIPPEIEEKNYPLDEFVDRVASYASESKKRFKDLVNIPSLYHEGIALLKKGEEEDNRKAHGHFSKILSTNPKFKGAWLNKGYAMGKLGDLEGEIICYINALQIDKNYKKAKSNINDAIKELNYLFCIDKDVEEIINKLNDGIIPNVLKDRITPQLSERATISKKEDKLGMWMLNDEEKFYLIIKKKKKLKIYQKIGRAKCLAIER